jgi:hypothetical protein
MSESNMTPEPVVPPPPPIEPAIPPPPPIEPVPLPPSIEVPIPDFTARKSRPLLGPSLWMFGALLWAQIVIGFFVVEKDLPEPFGFLGVAVVMGAVWMLSVKHRQRPTSLRFRHLAPVLLALLYWAGAVVFGLMVAAVANARVGVSILLWMLSVAAFFVGRRLTGPSSIPPTLARRAVTVLAWLGAIIFTLGALVQLFQAL